MHFRRSEIGSGGVGASKSPMMEAKMEKPRKTRAELEDMILRALERINFSYSTYKIRVRPHSDRFTDISWRAEFINSADNTLARWPTVLFAIVPPMQMDYDLADAEDVSQAAAE
jgi:hypothetical protein